MKVKKERYKLHSIINNIGNIFILLCKLLEANIDHYNFKQVDRKKDV